VYVQGQNQDFECGGTNLRAENIQDFLKILQDVFSITYLKTANYEQRDSRNLHFGENILRHSRTSSNHHNGNLTNFLYPNRG
jgi:hypothetical protein